MAPVSIEEAKEKTVNSSYKSLGPFLNELEVWRVGIRMREFTPFNLDHNPPAQLPKNRQLAMLLMRQAHERHHAGVEDCERVKARMLLDPTSQKACAKAEEQVHGVSVPGPAPVTAGHGAHPW